MDKLNVEPFTSACLFQTPSIYGYSVDQLGNSYVKLLNATNLIFRFLRIKVPGSVCGRHHRKIIGWRSDNGQVYHDDGYCSKRDRCFSEDGLNTQKCLIIFLPNAEIPNNIQEFCRQEVPNPDKFRWLS